jgi:hypothetical protein
VITDKTGFRRDFGNLGREKKPCLAGGRHAGQAKSVTWFGASVSEATAVGRLGWLAVACKGVDVYLRKNRSDLAPLASPCYPSLFQLTLLLLASPSYFFSIASTCWPRVVAWNFIGSSWHWEVVLCTPLRIKQEGLVELVICFHVDIFLGEHKPEAHNLCAPQLHNLLYTKSTIRKSKIETPH